MVSTYVTRVALATPSGQDIGGVTLGQSVVTPGTSSSTAIVANANRRFLTFINLGASDITLSLAPTAVLGVGYVLVPGERLIFEAMNVPANAFSMIATDSGGSLLIWEA